MRETLGVNRPSLGTDLGLAQKVVEGFADTVNCGGVLPPVIAIDAKGFPLKEIDAIAHYAPGRSAIEINPLNRHWTGDTAASQLNRFTEQWSSSGDPNATFFHETGHYLHQANIRNSSDSVKQFV